MISQEDQMLVLTRKPGEKIFIGDDILIQVVDIHDRQVRVGIEAPTKISIYRGGFMKR